MLQISINTKAPMIIINDMNNKTTNDVFNALSCILKNAKEMINIRMTDNTIVSI